MTLNIHNRMAMMKKLATLIDVNGRPTGLAKIIRRGAKRVRIHRYNEQGQLNPAEETVNRSQLVEDDGHQWQLHQKNPQLATCLSTASRQPFALVRVKRVYKYVSKVEFYYGDNHWSPIQDVPTTDLLWDGGQQWGMRPPQHALNETSATPSQDKSTTPNVGSSQRISYIRVSSTGQNLIRQRETIGHVDREFSDEISASTRQARKGLQACLDYLRAGDELMVASIDRLARSVIDLHNIIDSVTQKGASITFIKEGMTFSAHKSDPRTLLMLGILGSFAEFERAIIKERQTEGIAQAKARGVYKGRKKKLSQPQIEYAKTQIANGATKTQLAQELGITRATLYKSLKKNI